MSSNWVWPGLNGAESNRYRVVFQNDMVEPTRPVRIPLGLPQTICFRRRRERNKKSYLNCDLVTDVHKMVWYEGSALDKWKLLECHMTLHTCSIFVTIDSHFTHLFREQMKRIMYWHNWLTTLHALEGGTHIICRRVRGSWYAIVCVPQEVGHLPASSSIPQSIFGSLGTRL